jgi:hypothetical protein
MMPAFSRALMTLACQCLGEGRRAWAQAMQAEFDIAVEDGRALSFAAGCLIGALRQMPMQEEGRFVLTNYTLALAVMVPIAAIEISAAMFGLPHLFGGLRDPGAGMTFAQKLIIGGAFRVVAPSLTLLLLLCGGAQLRLAWLMLERDWTRATSTGVANLAAITTLILFMGCMFLDVGQAVTLAAVLGIELALIAGLGRWHAELNLPPS